jgi:DNA-binding PadR family transcriptional regulator
MSPNEKIDAATAARELTLALLFLNRFREKVGPNSWTPWRAWKGFDFDTLDKLVEAGLISSSRTAKSVSLTDEGLAEAQRLLDKFGIADWPKLEGKV